MFVFTSMKIRKPAKQVQLTSLHKVFLLLEVC